MPIIDSDLELRGDWEVHIGADISGIPNPPLPTKTGWNNLYGAREFYVEGPAGADVLYAVHRPLHGTSGVMHMAFDLMSDVRSLKSARCLEFDNIITYSKLKYNMSGQFNFNNGQFQVANAVGGWVDTGIQVARFLPFQWYPIQFDYWWDSVAKRFSFMSMSMNCGAHAIPIGLQNLSAVATNWADTASLQVQLDVDTMGGGFSIYMRKLRYIWDVA